MFYVIFGRIVTLSHVILNFPNNFLDDDVGFDVIGCWVVPRQYVMKRISRERL